MSKRLCSTLVIAIAAVLFSPAVWGQATGSFSGTVTDKSGSPVSGATVTVTSQGTGAVRETTTDEPGHYTVNPANTHPHALFASVYLLNHWGVYQDFQISFSEECR
jgi:Carboxypeptidase regulatory-like domain